MTRDMTHPTASIVRQIWSHPSCVLMIFAGSSAEFAVNPEAEWLFYTGRLPADPIGRFMGTIQYARRLIFAPTEADYIAAVRQIRNLHTALERQREQLIPEGAYMDVLFMNIEYTMRASQLVFGGRLGNTDRSIIVQEFCRVGELMGLSMPVDLAEYEAVRKAHLESFKVTEWTPQLMRAFRQALGPVRFFVLRVVYGVVVDPRVLSILQIKRGWLSRLLGCWYPYFCRTPFEQWLRWLILPARLRRGLAYEVSSARSCNLEAPKRI